MMTARSARRFGLAWLLLVTVLFSAHGEEAPTASEAQIKAAYLYKFPSFVDWPSSSFAGDASPMVIGVTGADAVYQELTRLATGHVLQGRPIEVRRVSLPWSGPPVHLLYIGPESRGETAAFLTQTAGRSVLIVTDNPAVTPAGAVLNLVEVEGRIRFEASLAAAATNRLKLSSRLLNVAVRVTDKLP